MESQLLQIAISLDLAAFVAVVLLHLVKSTKYTIRLYALQSAAVATVLVILGMAENERGLIAIGAITFVSKVIIAPFFFSRLVRRFGHLVASASYLSMPATLAVLLGLIVFAASSVFDPLWAIAAVTPDVFAFNIAMVLIAVFLLINRQGALAQIIAILALENSIVLFALFIGVKQTFALELGIVFDIVIWMVIAYAFLRLVYRQFGSLDTREMRQLIED
jgi:hydrogenase-4 membrane subunit HyfE